MSAGAAPADGPPKTGGRVDAIDCARGVALIGMALYHLSWDLADYQLVSPMLPFSPPMRLFSHAVACTFLALVGVSLALAQRNRLNLPAFLRRLAIVAAAAALVTVGSLIFAPGEGIWFGILHCIVAASVLALPFIEAPAFASLLVGAAAIVIPFFVHSPLFDPPALLWIGLGKALPNTLDWYPLLPWAGVVFIGLGLALLPGVLGRIASPKRWRASSGPARAVCFAGRHSLADLSGPPADLIPPRLDGRRFGPLSTGPAAEAGLRRLSRGLRARLRRRRPDGGRLRNLVPVRRRRRSSVPARRSGSARMRSTQGARPSSNRWPKLAWPDEPDARK